MRILIVDDEPLARTALANVLAARSDIEAFDSAENAVEALEKLQKEQYDVMLLDIDLPELSGIELADRLNKSARSVPAVIFVTAHEEHAVAAFETHAVDYVLKPFANERIHEALDIAIRRTLNERTAGLMGLIPHLRALVSKSSKIAIKVDGRVVFIDPAEVFSAEAEGNYVLLSRSSGSYLFRAAISALAENLRPYGFIRIHRSILVNSSWVQDIQACASGEYRLRIKGGKEYRVSRTYKPNLKSLAQLRIGNDSLFGE
jgi:two-component system, LytTR family, response regulator